MNHNDLKAAKEMLECAGHYAKEYVSGSVVMFKDKYYVVNVRTNMGGERTKFWQQISDKSPLMFNPNNVTFFMIGNTKNCPPCRDADAMIRKHIASHPGMTYEHWNYNMSNGRCDHPDEQKWLELQGMRDDEVRTYRYIPKIWVRGKFIRGKAELQNMI